LVKRKKRLEKLIDSITSILVEQSETEQEHILTSMFITLLLNSDLNLYQCLGVLRSAEHAIWDKSQERKEHEAFYIS